MNKITQNNVVTAGGGGGQRRGGAGARSSTPAAVASFAAVAVWKGGRGAEWQMATRGKAKAQGAKRTTISVRPSVVEEGDGSQQFAPSVEAASTAARKRKAEGRVHDKPTAMAATIKQLMTA
jgi:hypothetical protein